MIFPPPVLLEEISSRMTLQEGDLVLTGTPEGVAQVKDGDVIHALLRGAEGDILSELWVDVKDE